MKLLKIAVAVCMFITSAGSDKLLFGNTKISVSDIISTFSEGSDKESYSDEIDSDTFDDTDEVSLEDYITEDGYDFDSAYIEEDYEEEIYDEPADEESDEDDEEAEDEETDFDMEDVPDYSESEELSEEEKEKLNIYICCDINKDGEVDIIDRFLLEKYLFDDDTESDDILSEELLLKKYDVTSNGVINIMDLTALNRIISETAE